MKPAWWSSAGVLLHLSRVLRCNKTPAELHRAGFIYYNLHDARNHENQIHKCKASNKRLRLREQQKKNVQDQRSVMVQQNVQRAY